MTIELDYLTRRTFLKSASIGSAAALLPVSFGIASQAHTKSGDLARIILELTKRGYDDRMVATIDLTAPAARLSKPATYSLGHSLFTQHEYA